MSHKAIYRTLSSPLRKRLTLVTRPPPTSSDAVQAAPSPQQPRTTTAGALTPVSRTGPHRGRPKEKKLPPGQPQQDRVRVSASPAGVALQAPVPAVSKSLPSASIRASLASSRVRRRRHVRPCRRDIPNGSGCARTSQGCVGPAPLPDPMTHPWGPPSLEPLLLTPSPYPKPSRVIPSEDNLRPANAGMGDPFRSPYRTPRILE